MLAKGGIPIAAETQPGSAMISVLPAFSPLIFNQPTALLQAPNDPSTWFVLERQGYVKRFRRGDAVSVVFADLTAKIASAAGEQGLLGLAFHPMFPAIPRIFVSYTNTSGNSVISRFNSSPDGQSFLPNSETVLMTVAQPFTNHNGGNMAFGPDGHLYIGFGDGGSGGDPQDQAQNTNSLLGAMLRIDVDTGSLYGIPPDNPFSNSAGCGLGPGCPEIFAYGFRNPWRWSFDRVDGRLWAGDVGQSAYEEIDVVDVGKNYGWRCYEGTHPYNLAGCGPAGDYTPPVAEYDHTAGECSVTGGYVYRGSRIPELEGAYMYGDYCTGKIWGLFSQGGIPTTQLLVDTGLLISSFGEGNDGELYVVSYAEGKIYRLSRAPVFPAGAILGPLLLE
ncbi:MAG: PQQ-dependent sugar dehydrogenase [Deltaproteobacteria bacterium]|nr:PQQ-dependent sugar dehydrogenase [Deltaproteobacteria bacterium]